MSTLTKVLIVLLAISSIFLCGIVVTYVGNADNYKQQYDRLKADRDSFNSKVNSLNRQLEKLTTEKKQAEDSLGGEVSTLKQKYADLEGKLSNAEREKAQQLQEANKLASLVQDLSQTNDEQQKLLQQTLDELKRVQADQIRERKELNEKTDALVEKMAIIQTLETEQKRLLEEKALMQRRMNQLLGTRGQVVSTPAAVTPRRTVARPAQPAPTGGQLQGVITAVDLKNSMASVSVGSADGVREGMKLHVTRGDEFVCDILIIDVDVEEAVGILELMQKQPGVGDRVSTNL